MSGRQVCVEVGEVGRALAKLGLDPEVLRQAVWAAEVERGLLTANDAPIIRGLRPWGAAVRALREALVPGGWRRCDEGNYSLVIHDERRVALAVATGDEWTGHPTLPPRTKSAKGPATAQAVERNADNLEFPFMAELREAVARRRGEGCATWLLLFAPVGEEVRCELSLPTAIGEDGRIAGWSERIVLAPVPREPRPGLAPEALDEGPSFEVDISRRA